eukprot:TRINITY_DN42069_c0_g1_i1.p1 TRINITY_DN42069_c0_g1~~TRINITY_DN42069_c0_g1_i1.p1  ORF type:complete len:178 (-),score=26.16 TRINITY_DN42069_c0_g1_i1:73-606(-)
MKTSRPPPAPKLAVGYDPVQRAAQWAKRVDREEMAISHSLRGPVSSANARLDSLQRSLDGVGAYETPSLDYGRPGATPAVALTSSSLRGDGYVPGAVDHMRLSSRQSVSSAGRSILTTPRRQTAASVRSELSSAPSRISVTSSTLRGELEEEKRRRIAAEEEMRRLQGLLEDMTSSG